MTLNSSVAHWQCCKNIQNFHNTCDLNMGQKTLSYYISFFNPENRVFQILDDKNESTYLTNHSKCELNHLPFLKECLSIYKIFAHSSCFPCKVRSLKSELCSWRFIIAFWFEHQRQIFVRDNHRETRHSWLRKHQGRRPWCFLFNGWRCFSVVISLKHQHAFV